MSVLSLDSMAAHMFEKCLIWLEHQSKVIKSIQHMHVERTPCSRSPQMRRVPKAEDLTRVAMKVNVRVYVCVYVCMYVCMSQQNLCGT